MRDALAAASRALLALVGMLCIFALPHHADALVDVPVTHNFRYDGRTSDFAQQYFHLHQAGHAAPQLEFSEDRLPADVRDELRRVGLHWTALPGLLQRALIWDFGYAMTLRTSDGKNSTAFVTMRTLGGRSMAEIHVARKAYERAGCIPLQCGLPTGELTYRSRWCNGDQIETVSLCASDDVEQAFHSTMWAEGAGDTFVPELNMNRHFWTEYNDAASYLIYAVHTHANDQPWNICPTLPAPIIPCVSYSKFQSTGRFLRPARGKIVRPWLQNFAESNKLQSFWVYFAIVLSLAAVLAVVAFVVSTYMRYKTDKHGVAKRGSLLDQEEDYYSNSSTPSNPGTDTQDELDAAARRHFASIIGLTSPARMSASSASRCSDSFVHEYEDTQIVAMGTDCPRRPPSALYTTSTSLCTTPTSTRGRERSSTSRRAAHACSSFHLFESHRQIRRKRVQIQEIQFHEVLNNGSTGEVWLASLRGQHVAVKQLLVTKRKVLKEMEMFMAEIFLVAQLHHPNIVPLVGVAWSTLEQLMMIQEYMSRGDLQAFLKNELQRRTTRSFHDTGEFTWQRQKLAVARAVASALAYLHHFSPQIVHRDIKSKNVLLSDTMAIKLCDFGICRRQRNEDEGGSNMTVSDVAGTMSWTAPEVLMGDAYGDKVDIYSYAVLLCEIDTCLLPYHDPEGLASRLIYHPLRLMKHIQQGLRPKLSPSCPPKIQALIQACWAGDPMVRPTADQVVAALAAADIVE